MIGAAVEADNDYLLNTFMAAESELDRISEEAENRFWDRPPPHDPFAEIIASNFKDDTEDLAAEPQVEEVTDDLAAKTTLEEDTEELPPARPRTNSAWRPAAEATWAKTAGSGSARPDTTYGSPGSESWTSRQPLPSPFVPAQIETASPFSHPTPTPPDLDPPGRRAGGRHRRYTPRHRRECGTNGTGHLSRTMLLLLMILAGLMMLGVFLVAHDRAASSRTGIWRTGSASDS